MGKHSISNFSKHSFTQASSLLDLVHSGVCALQEILAFLTQNFSKKNPPYGFFAPMSNLTKVPFWKGRFGLDHFD